jgi:uncharacterized membrane protein
MPDTTDHADPDDGDDASPAADTPADPRVGTGLLDVDMGPSSALAHLYRGEIHRMTLWRERLDRTTNWAVIVLAGVLTWAFSAPSNPHYVLVAGGVVLALFLVVEARRYRGYDIWRSRVRTLQRNVWTVGLDPDGSDPAPDWRERLADDYREPTVKISAEEAIAHRLRRIYLPLLSVLLVAWVLRVTAFAAPDWPGSAAVGMVPGVAVTAVVGAAYLAALVVACRPREWRARGELREEELRRRD